MLFEHDIFETQAEILLDVIRDKSKMTWLNNYPEIPYAYKFPELGLYLGREYIPSDCEDIEDNEFYSRFEFIGIGHPETEE